MRTRRRRGGAAGQVMVLMVGGIVAVIGMMALVVDGGNVWAQQRVTQNGADAAAEAGAVVMAQRLAGATTPSGGWDAEISAQIQTSAAANHMTVRAAYYTDICGIPLELDGDRALNTDGTEDLSRADRVGSGSLPSSSNTTPDCPSLTAGPPAGVLVLAQKVVPSYIAGAVGISSFTVGTRATAVAGYLQGYCAASQGQACAVLPVAIPVNVVTCDGQNNPQNTGTPWVLNQVYRVPLCGNGAGNVGWLDWTPPGGGASDVVCEILHPNNPAINLPSWQYVAQSGNINGGGGPCSMSVQDAIRTYDGEVVLIPQFDVTCSPPNNTTPDSTVPAVNTAPDYGCPSGYVGGNGQNEWYRMPSFAYFQLCSSTDTDCVNAGDTYGAYIGGNNQPQCDSGNGATSCLVGKFVNILATGTVGPGVGGGTSSNKALGVQLIK